MISQRITLKFSSTFYSRPLPATDYERTFHVGLLFIISDCNGAGKSTVSFTILPELLKLKEVINADEIARGLSPFQLKTVSIEAGKIMLRRVQDLIS